MAVLVGIYLVQGDVFEIVRDGRSLWIGAWTLFRSPWMNHADWEALTSGETAACFDRPELAIQAGAEEGVAFARELQGDDGLEPMAWVPPPVSSSIPLKRACGGWH